MRALVIGGTGFLGLNIVDALLASGAEVRVSRRKQSVTLLVRKRKVELCDASLDEPEKLRRAMDGCDVVFLAGAHYPRYSIDFEASLETGVRGVRNACEAAVAAQIPRLVYTSTIATLCWPKQLRRADEDDVPEAMPTDSVYRGVKWSMEREVESFQRKGLNAVTLLPGGCIGPGDLRLGTGSIIVGVVRGIMPFWVDGFVNIIDVGDVAKAHVAAASPTAHDRYLLGGHTVRVPTLLRRIAMRYGGRVPALRLTADEARARTLAEERAAAPRKERVMVPRELVDMAVTGQAVSNARVKTELGLVMTPLDDALDRAHASLSSFGFIPKRTQKEVIDEHS